MLVLVSTVSWVVSQAGAESQAWCGALWVVAMGGNGALSTAGVRTVSWVVSQVDAES